MSAPLGQQTATLIVRVRGQHNQTVDGEQEVWDGCSLQPETSETRETVIDGRAQTERRWKLYAPAGSRARSTDVITVSPGPVDDDGAPLRMALAGPPSPWWDQLGREHYVRVPLRAIER